MYTRSFPQVQANTVDFRFVYEVSMFGLQLLPLLPLLLLIFRLLLLLLLSIHKENIVIF